MSRFLQISACILFCLSTCCIAHGVTKRVPLTRSSQTPPITIPDQVAQPCPTYPWDGTLIGGFPRITKTFFRCKGSTFNPAIVTDEDPIVDCGGSDSHGLPLRNGTPFIYPILLDLLNHVQSETSKKVVITSGHRCPAHNTYVDASRQNRYSKHMVGAEVSFYMESVEHDPERIVALLIDFYRADPDDAFRTFHRYTKEDTNVSSPPWYNKEVFIKLFAPDEGRNGDNQHPYPYIAIQVKYDREAKSRVTYNWNDAHRNYVKWE